MDAQLNQQCATLRAMSSAEAAQWLLREYPAASPASAVALQLIPHRSWQRSEQRLLAEHYLTLSFASARPYQAFCSIMPTRVLADWVAQRLPQSPRDRSLLAYLLLPTLKQNTRTERDAEAMERLAQALRDKAESDPEHTADE
ncbi:hypothetical protein [Pseudomonas sp. MF4836]|uniref:hypothetical protein n=1 Tax=Pseudomonas sp. MF4836 TaxID=1960827 RepID=UPI000996D9F2|nr:hypothetical protein [Pseudomonas sp. MF4836]OOV89528.1 hypothetical protein MF4836_33005 [Pseudomonas sp. MF4836]